MAINCRIRGFGANFERDKFFSESARRTHAAQPPQITYYLKRSDCHFNNHTLITILIITSIPKKIYNMKKMYIPWEEAYEKRTHRIKKKQ